MSARVLWIDSGRPGRAGEILAAGLCRSLANGGHSLQFLNLDSSDSFRLTAADGSIVTRTTAVLAEAARLESTGCHEQFTALEALRTRSEILILLNGGFAPPGGLEVTPLDPVALRPPLPSFERFDIFPSVPEDIAAMDPLTVGGLPRLAVVSLPHITNFGDFQLLRGAEWLTAPAPGRFSFVFLPATADPGADQGWLESQGIAPWLEDQASQGCTIVTTGWNRPGARTIGVGELEDWTFVSRLLGRRVGAPLPLESDLDALARRLELWRGYERFLEMLFAPKIDAGLS